MPSPLPIVVVGGGVGGLAAAWYAAEAGYDVVVLEATDRVGGKLESATVGGVQVDVGAEAMLARRPEGADLAAAAGLTVVHPATTGSLLWTRGELRPLPRSLMGVPLDLPDLAASGVLSEAGLAAVRAEPALPPTDLRDDVAVGELVAARLGEEVVDRLLEPLLGGVYAGRSRELSLRATVPQLVPLLARGSLVEAAAGLAHPGGPVFAGVEGGLGRLPAALAAHPRVEVRSGTTVRALRRTPDGLALVADDVVAADRVVLAVPAAPAARLLGEVAPAAATELGAVESASLAVVTLAFRAGDVDLPAGTGFLVPPVDGRSIKAATFSSAKWGWLAAAASDLVLLRTSLGRHRETAVRQRPDAALVADSLTDLRAALGLTAAPVDTHVRRWGGGLPQYVVGHLDRVARIRAAVSAVPGLAVCGAAYDGVGIPAVIASARRAVGEVV